MNYDIQWWVDFASVATFIITAGGATIGIYGYIHYRAEWHNKRLALEAYLRAEKEGSQEDDQDRGQRTTLHLVRHVGLTEDEIIKISFESSNLKRKLVPDEAGYANALLFEYSGSN